MEQSDVLPRNVEIFKSCLAKIRENLKNMFLFQHHVIYSPVLLGDEQLLTPIGSLETKPIRFKLISQASNEKEVTNIFGRLIKTMFAKIKLNRLGRKFFDPASRKQYNEYDLAIFSGYESSLEKYAFNRKLLNIDSCFKV